jgi:hypothetical protein
MELAIKEMELANNAVLFTNRITNDELDKTEQQLCTLIEALYFQELKDKRGADYDPSITMPQKKLIDLRKVGREDRLEMKQEIKEYRESQNFGISNMFGVEVNDEEEARKFVQAFFML